MVEQKKSNYQQGNTSPADYFENKKKSNKFFGLCLGLLVIALASLVFVI